MENLNLFYQDIGPSSSAGGHLTQEEATKEALAIRISQKFALLEEERPVIETMAYQDKYKKILNEIWKDKVELDGKTMKEEEEAVKRIKGEALKEKDNPGAFIFPIRLEGKVNENALADTGSDINTMTYRIYETLGRQEMKKIDRGITMINHTQEEALGKLSNVLCQVGVDPGSTSIRILIVSSTSSGNAGTKVYAAGLQLLRRLATAKRIQTSLEIPTPVAFQTDDLDAFDSDCDEASSASTVFMAKVSSCDLEILSEVPIHDNYLDNYVFDQNVQEMQYSEQPVFNNDIDIDITSDSNMISYEQYLKEIENMVVQNTSSSA
ncbi:hypothetical protein Tco_1419412 [Tanacetum coccineum]